MSTSSYDSINVLGTFRYVISPGVTNAMLLNGPSVKGCNSTIIKYFSGGTLEIIGVPSGVTYGGATLLALDQTGYLVGTSEVLSFDGPVRCYLSATGATVVAMIIHGKTVNTT